MNAIKLVESPRVVRLQIDNPRRRNALSRAMWRELAALVSKVAQTGSASVLVLESSTPGCFAAGADISEFADNYAEIETTREVNREIHAAIAAMERCAMPTLALIDGPCVGGGLALALACDFRLASSNARFALTPSRLGLSYHPDDVRLLLDACGPGNASEMLFGAQAWTAERAHQAGLVNDVTPADAFNDRAAQLIDAICSNSRQANQILKRTIKSVRAMDSVAIKAAENAFDALFQSPDFLAGRDAFLSKTPVRFPSNEPVE